jgi:hypothetical protein
MLGQVLPDCSTHGVQARTKENCGAVNGSRGEHHVSRHHVAVRRSHSRGAAIFDQDSVDQHVSANFEVGSSARRIKVGVIRGDPPTRSAGRARWCGAEDSCGLVAVATRVAAFNGSGNHAPVEG